MKSQDAFILRFREKDTPIGISLATAKQLTEITGLTMTDMIHKALVEFADKYAPDNKNQAEL